MAINENILKHVKEVHRTIRFIRDKISKKFPSLISEFEKGDADAVMVEFNNMLPFSAVYVWENRFEYWLVLFSENKFLSRQFEELLVIVQNLKKLISEVYEYGAAKPEFYVKKQIELICPSTFNKMDVKLDLIEEMIKKLQN